MGQINLEVIDAPLLEETNFGDHQQQWLTNMVDIVNASFALIQNAFNFLITAAGIDIGGMGVSPVVTCVGLTDNGYVNATIVSTTNSVRILSVVAGTGQFTVNFSADPGASAIIYYQAFARQP